MSVPALQTNDAAVFRITSLSEIGANAEARDAAASISQGMCQPDEKERVKIGGNVRLEGIGLENDGFKNGGLENGDGFGGWAADSKDLEPAER